MKPSFPPRMAVLLILTSLSSPGAETLAKPAPATAPTHPETSASSRFSSPSAVKPDDKVAAAIKSTIPRAIPVVEVAPEAKPVVELKVRRESVSIHPITVKNGPQPYVIEPDSLQKGLTLISELYRKSGRR
jgi:hypothetical protein